MKDEHSAEAAERAAVKVAERIEEVCREEGLNGAACGWRSCTGCHESSEGVPQGAYSPTFKTHLGIGCSECGGLGVVWEYWSKDGLDAMAREDATLSPAESEPEQEAVARPRTDVRALIADIEDGRAAGFLNDGTEQDAALACPYCGGSGHRDDVGPTPRPPSEQAVTEESRLAQDILTELVRAREKFPGKNVTFAALVEEVGELATATFEESRDRVRKEAVQVAVMAMRMVLDGDHTFDDWRSSKGLDPLTAAMEAKR